jgi:hypothetical protein
MDCVSILRRWIPSSLGFVLVALAGARGGSGEIEGGLASQPVWRIGQPVALAVNGGHARFQVPAPQAGSPTLVIVSSLANSPGPFPVRLTAQGTSRVNPPQLEPPSTPPARAARLAAPRLEPITEPAAGIPAAERTFHILARDGDVASASNYLPVRGVLRALGQRVQVYVDSDDVARVGPAVLRDLVASFDGEVFPLAARTIGQARDVDGDGRFTVFLSSWLGRLAGGRHVVDGFVRGADLDPVLEAPFSNRCDMMYLSASLESGPYLRTVLAHEYTHAVTYTAKTFTGPDGDRLGPDEEGWLDEAIAHLGEDLHGFSRANLDYRISAFLSCPERYRLVVEDYYAADLFRSHGNRGGTYLFLRWCVDRYGPELLPKLVRSSLRGAANLEAATGTSFADLYRQWSTSLSLDGREPEPSAGRGYRSLDPRGRVGSWELAGPRTTRLAPDGTAASWAAEGTTSHYVVIEASPLGAVDVEVRGPEDARLQVTAIPLEADLPELELTAELVSEPGSVPQLHARLHERNGVPLTLSALAWEPLVPVADPRAARSRHGALDADALRSAFGQTTLPAHGELASRPLPLPDLADAPGPFVFKAVAIDSHGRKVAAWAEIDPTTARTTDARRDRNRR